MRVKPLIIKNKNNITNERKYTMKTTRRIITIALALVLALSLAVPALADEVTPGITVTGSGTTTYKVFKIFDIDVVANGQKYELTADWADFTAPGYFKVENGYAIWEKNTTSAADAAAIAQQAKNYVTTKGLTTNTTVTVGQTLEVTNGYYLLVPAEGPCGVVLVKDTVALVQEKTAAAGQPTVDKLVQEDADGFFTKENDADIGQEFDFQVTITAGVNAEKYVLHDVTGQHIVFLGNVRVSRDGNLINNENDKYYRVITNPGDECAFHVEFTDELCKDLAEGAKLAVRYSCMLNEGATYDSAHGKHDNTAWLTYTSANATTDKSYAYSSTYKITVYKVDNADPANPLSGATFILRDNVGMYYKWNEDDKKVEWVPKADATSYTTGADGKVEFLGVDAENFHLEEIGVPDGYIGTTDVPVSTKNGNAEIIVTNTLGTALPETGGMGTTVFYIMGAALVMGALAVLVIMKRKETNAQ